MDWLDLLAVQGTLNSSPTPQFKSINSSVLSFLYSPTLTSIHEYWKNHSFSSKEQAFFNFMTAVTICSGWEPKKIKSLSVFIVSPFICHEVMGLDAMILVFWMFSFKPTFSLSSFAFIKRLFSFSSLSAIRGVGWGFFSVYLPASSLKRWFFSGGC